MKMNRIKSGKSLYLWIIAILVILNLSTIGTIIYNKQQFEKENEMMIQRLPREQRPDFLREDFHKNDQFFLKHRELRRDYRNDARELAQEMNRKRIALLKYLSSENPDTLQLRKMAEEFGELHRDLKLLTIDFFLKTKSITSPEEQEQLFRYFQYILEKDKPHPGHRRRSERMKQNMRDTVQ